MDDKFVWTPPGVGEAELNTFLTLRTGIPAHANESIHRWLVDGESERQVIPWSFMLDFQQSVRVDFNLHALKYVLVSEAYAFFRGLSEIHRAWLVDFELSRIEEANAGYRKPRRVQEMHKILSDSGSSWTVKATQGRYRLVEKLPGAVFDVVESILSSEDKASELLGSAWNFAFGVNTSPSHAYYDAVRSVEVLSCPLISPRDTSATLGKDISVLRNSPDKWNFTMADAKSGTSIDKVTSMMQLLWHSQTDRHGRADYEDVSLQEAQAAVLLASTLVAWLAKGMLSRVEAQ